MPKAGRGALSNMPSARPSKPSGLALRALIGFVASFASARTFTTFYPGIVVAGGGIHFHHFWYGLGIVLVAGWLGIASSRPELDRAYAFVFGIGTGLIGDEVGLLLTFGDYRSVLTFEFAVVGVALASVAILVVRYWSEIREDLASHGKGERLIAVGVTIGAFSALPAAFGLVGESLSLLAIGILFIAVGVVIHRRFLAGR